LNKKKEEYQNGHNSKDKIGERRNIIFRDEHFVIQRKNHGFDVKALFFLINSNKNLLYTITSNLLSNAYQYTPSQGSVWFRIKIKKKVVRIEVEDNGPGIPQNEQKRVFERFYRLNSARSVYSEGSGLGLSIVKHSVELLSGTLGITSEPGKGSLFWVELPLL